MAARKDDSSKLLENLKNSKKAGVAKRPSTSAGAKRSTPKRPAAGGVYKALPVKKKTKGTVSIY